MAVFPRSELQLVGQSPADPFIGSIELTWSFRDASRSEAQLKILVDIADLALSIQSPETTRSITIDASAITNDHASSTTSIDLPGLLKLTLDSGSGRCLFAHTPLLTDLSADAGRARAVTAR